MHGYSGVIYIKCGIYRCIELRLSVSSLVKRFIIVSAAAHIAMYEISQTVGPRLTHRATQLLLNRS